MIKKILLMSVLLVPGVAMSADKCEKEWKLVLKRNVGLSEENVLKEWEQKKAICADSWFYEYKKISQYISARNYIKARELSVAAKMKYADSSPFDLMIFELDRLELDPNVDATLGEIKKYAQRLEELKEKPIAAYPEYKIHLADIKLLLQDGDEAIVLAKEALALNIDITSGVWLTLAEAYELKNDYPASKDALDHLFSIKNDSLLEDNRVLLLSARVCAAVGSWEAAQHALNMAAGNASKGAEDPEVKKTIKYIKDKLAAGEFKPPANKASK